VGEAVKGKNEKWLTGAREREGAKGWFSPCVPQAVAKGGRGTTKSSGLRDESRRVLAESSQVFGMCGGEGVLSKSKCNKSFVFS